MATLAIVGAMMSSCAEELEVAQPANTDKTMMVKTTVSLGENAATRALTTAGEKTFASGEQIAVIYKNTDDQTVKAVSLALTTDDIDNTDAHNATFSVSLTNPKPGEPVRYIYPASRAVDNVSATTPDNDATINYAALATQDGTFASLASNLDLATFDGNLTESGTLPATASLTNPLTIGKFTIKNSGGTDITSSITGLNISDGTNTYAVSREAADGPIYVAMQPITSTQTVAVNATDGTNHYTKTVTENYALVASKIYDITVNTTSGVDLSKLTADYEAQDGDVLTGTLAGNYKISIADGATVTLDGVTINGYNSSDYKWAGITCEGDAIIILKDGSENTVKGFYDDYPGITCPVENTLTIKGETLGTGSLTASSNGYGAGIGGGFSISCGNIEIQGGVITATGVYNSPGIGAGQGASIGPSTCGTITISGGTVIAIGGTNSAGIGSGYASSNPSTCDAITISGGTVTATAGENAPAAIGKGEEDEGESTCASVTLGNITSVSMTNAAQTGLVGDFVNAKAVIVGESPITDYLDRNVNAVTSVMMQAGYTSNLSGNTWTVAKQ